MSHLPEASTQPSNQLPIYFAGGLGYDATRNNGVLEYLRTLGHETIPPLPDQGPGTIDLRFTVAAGGISSVVSLVRAMRLAGKEGHESITSNYQQTRAEELIT